MFGYHRNWCSRLTGIYTYIRDLTKEDNLRDNRVERICPIFSGLNYERQDIFQLLTLPNERSKGIKELSQFTKDTEKLMIIDPYFYSGPKGAAISIANDFKKCARIGGTSLKSIHIIYDDKNFSNSIKNSISQLAEENKVTLTTATTNNIHDRIWISDRSSALLVGTSLNGLGTRAAFLIKLPHNDLINLLKYLDDNKLSRTVRR